MVTSANAIPPKPPRKRQRRSRFSSLPSSDPLPKDPNALPSSTTTTTEPHHAPAVTPPAPAPAVQALRARTAQRKAAALSTTLPNSSNITATPISTASTSSLEIAANQPSIPPTQNTASSERRPNVTTPAPKRLKTGRSRFSQASIPAKPPQPMPSLATTAIPTIAKTPQPTSSTPTPVPRLDITKIPIAPVAKTLNINRKAAKQAKQAISLKLTQSDILETDPTRNPHHDPNLPTRTLKTSSVTRPRRPTLAFRAPGVVAARAETARKRAEAAERQRQFVAEVTGDGAMERERPVLPPLAEDVESAVRGKGKGRGEGEGQETVPLVEWWDVPFLARPEEGYGGGGNDADLDGTTDIQMDDGGEGVQDNNAIAVREERITHYIHHPPPIKGAKRKKTAVVVPLMLTKKETKKLRRQRRREAQQEKEDMIAAGLLPPPAPKVKLSNMMRVLATEASADPTKVEAEVRAQIAARRRKHEEDNEARKKTGEERREKARLKRAKDKEEGIVAGVFRVGDLSNGAVRFKVDVNARQLEMTGVMVVFAGCNVVVVEGGAKALRKFKKLMLRRIDWSVKTSVKKEEVKEELWKQEDMLMEEKKEEQKDGVQNVGCVMVWEGVISSPNFSDFSVASVKNEEGGRRIFERHDVEHYWDLCTQATLLGNEKLGVRRV